MKTIIIVGIIVASAIMIMFGIKKRIYKKTTMDSTEKGSGLNWTVKMEYKSEAFIQETGLRPRVRIVPDNAEYKSDIFTHRQILVSQKNTTHPQKEEKISYEDFNKLFNVENRTSQHTQYDKDNKIPAVSDYSKPKVTKTVQNKIEYLKGVTQSIGKKEKFIFFQEQKDISKLTINYQKDLNEKQFYAATTIDGPLLIIAGAGSGKTRTLSYRVAYMVESGIHPDNILLLTFTRKASKEMLERSNALLKNRNINIAGGTFHAFANSILRKYSNVLGLNPNFTIIDTIDSQDVIDLVRRELKFEKREKAFPRKKIIQSIISKSRNCRLTIKQIINQDYKGIKEFSDDIVEIYKYYKEYNRSHRQYDYDDLLEILYESLKKNDKFKKLIQQKFTHVMVDEFQDTNILQKQIVDIIAEMTKNIMVVGDDSQSIYAFRGANFENILIFPETYQDCKVIKLEQNYRSKQNLLDFTNDIVEHFSLGYKKQLFSKDNRAGYPTVSRFYDQGKEAEWIVKQIINLQEKEVSLKNISVLYRAGYHSNFLQAELIKRMIPFVVFGGIRFIERRHVKDIIAYLRIMLNPIDAVSWNRILKILPEIGNVTASNIIHNIHQNEGRIDFSAFRGKKYFEELSKLQNVLNANLTPEESIVTKIDNLKKYYTPILKSLENDYVMRLQDIDVLISLATKYNTDLEKYLTDFALDPPSNKIQDSTLPSVNESDDDKLVLSTVHSAKGLEWNYVFILHMLDGLFPSAKSLNKIEDLEEERRLFYVATTRAKDELYITMPSMVASYDAFFTMPSRFISEINDNKYKYFLGE